MSSPSLCVIVLTFNSEASVGLVIEASKGIASRILVVDSFSTDKTRQIACELGCEFMEHPFENYSAQRNWAQQQARIAPNDWVLHLDSDEVLSPELSEAIAAAIAAEKPGVNGYLMRRLTYFLGRPIRHGHMNPSWHLRLFRAGSGECEHRLYDQHFILHEGSTERLNGILHDKTLVSIESWTASHNRWSTAEAIEAVRIQSGVVASGAVLKGSLAGDLRMRKRWLKNNVWYKMPLLIKPSLFFFYSYVLKLGFLDGKVGLVYHVLQAFWFRFLIDAKILEQRIHDSERPR